MFTQCPECGVAFRVTADVLKQAAGKVRCGGCGVAFNALNHLSEEKPAAPVQPAGAGAAHQVPELKPDEPAELEADTRPKSISAAQSAALLKTLDQLAGSDIRIEDTGVEWRVLDEDDINSSNDAPDAAIEADSAEISDTGSLRFVIEDESEAANSDAEIEADDEPSQVIDEMRFDDNTPLPDDFEFGAEASHDPEQSEPHESPAAAAEPAVETMQAQADLDLGAPDEWEDLLGDLDEPAAEQIEAVEAVEASEDEAEAEPVDDLDGLEELEAIDAELQAELEDSRAGPAEIAGPEPIAEEAVPIDEPPDMDTQFAIQAEAMGIDLSGMHSTSDDDVGALAEGVDEASGETSIEQDLIAAAFEAEAAVQELEEISSKERVLDLDEIEPGDDLDDEAAGEQEDEAAEEPEAPDSEVEEPEEAGADEVIEVDEDVDAEEDQLDDIELEVDLDVDAEGEEIADDDVQDIALPFDNDVENVIETIEASLDDIDEPGDASAGASDEPEVPEMSEEEKTINMMIDQELFNIAVEDEEGFASTIVQIQPDKKVDDEIDDNKEEPKKKKKKKSEPAPLFETIVMEGETIRKDSDKGGLDGGDSAENVALSLPFNQESAKRGGRRDYDPPGVGMVVGIVALVLLLVVQVLHQSREALATVPAFSNTVGPLYRMLGKPLTPTWDISGWRFEATKGSTESAATADESGELTELADIPEILTIYSRVGNNSDKALPYPLVHLSLTDRYEDIIGSTVLEPSEYLAENADPRKLVPPGNTFNAVISIDSPSADATGFKLNVCYRLASGQLRCAIEDFK